MAPTPTASAGNEGGVPVTPARIQRQRTNSLGPRTARERIQARRSRDARAAGGIRARREPRHIARKVRAALRTSGRATIQRVPIMVAVLMLSVALFFDIVAGLGTKIMHLAGTFTSLIIGWIPWIGQLVGGAILGTAILIGEVAGWILMFFGYATLWLWFFLRGVPIFGGNRMALRFMVFVISVIVEMTPFLNIAPGLSVWTGTMILLTRHEDAHDKNATLTAKEAPTEG